MSLNVAKVIKLSVITSVFSKSSGLIFQVLAIPLALSALGTEGFARFMIYTGLTTWVGLSATGIAPTLTSKIASGLKNSDLIKNLYNALIFVSILMFFIGLPIFSLVIFFFGEKLGGIEELNLVYVYLFIGLLIIFSLVDSVNAGHNKVYITNAFQTLGSLLNLIILFMLIKLLNVKDDLFLFFASQSGLMLSKLLNFSFILKRLQWTYADLNFDRKIMLELKNNFFSFIFIQLSVAFSQQAIVIFTYTQSAVLSATLSVIYRLYSIMGSLLTMISQPLWPLIIGIRKKGDFLLLKKWYIRLLMYNFLVSSSLAFIVVLFKSEVNEYWLKGNIVISQAEYFLLLLNFVFIAIGQVNITFLMGYEKFKKISLMLTIEAMLLFGLVVLFTELKLLNVSLMMSISIISFLLTSFLIGSIEVNRALREASDYSIN